MTKEEAKDYIREWCPYDRQEEIIKALEQEPCGDCISRQAVTEVLLKYANREVGKAFAEFLVSQINDLPHVTPAEKQEPC
jgi:hypothetical protein